MTDRRRRLRRWAASLGALVVASGCASTAGPDPVSEYHAYRFTAAREGLRAQAARRSDDVVLDNLRLGLAAMADGSALESERALGTAFEYLSTAGLNKDRTTAAVVVSDKLRIWKGEPFEQALGYYWNSAHWATRGSWDNVRAAAANALFRLADFGRDMSQKKLVEKAARDEGYLEEGYTAVESDFALGFIMQAIGADRTGAGGAAEQFEAAVRIDPALRPLVETLRARRWDTLLLVDFGRGPQKIATGPDQAIVEFRPRESIRGPLSVAADGVELIAAPVVCDVDRMAQDHRWNNLEDVRRAKSAIGRFLMIGGLTAAGIGAASDSPEAAFAGLGAAALGALLRLSANADTRFLEFAPSAIYVVPLSLGRPVELRLQVGSAHPLVLPGFRPGTEAAPRAVYLRLFGAGAPTPPWMTAVPLLHGNDHSGVLPGDFPWVLGGGDVGTPSPERLRAYQAGGRLLDWNPGDLDALYRREGIAIGAGRDGTDASWRHILEGGRGLFTPMPDSMGYKRLMYSPVPPYAPRSPSTEGSPRP